MASTLRLPRFVQASPQDAPLARTIDLQRTNCCAPSLRDSRLGTRTVTRRREKRTTNNLLGCVRTSSDHIPEAHVQKLPKMSRGVNIASIRSPFVEGELGNLYSQLMPPTCQRSKRMTSGPRAASEDVPSYKGFPAMLKKPKWWWRVLACIPYLMPLSETWMYAETAYSLHPFLEDYEFFTYPFLTFIGKLPSWFLLAYFFGAYLGIVRNNRWPHFFRFHVVTGMLLEIIVQVVGTVNDWVPQSLYWGKIGAHYWLAVAFAFFFIVIECIRCALKGMYADVPFLSDASYMQIPYDT